MGLVFYLKLCGLAAMGLVAALVFRRGLAACHECVRGMSTQATMSPSARYEQIVEFTYSRTRPCNTDYYNYAFPSGR